MKINKYWILAIIGVFLVISGTIIVTNHVVTTNSNKSKNSSSHKETDGEYATKKFDEIKKISKTSNVIVVLYEPGKQYTSTFLDMVKTTEKNINYSGNPKVIYFKGDIFVRYWIEQGYTKDSNAKDIMKTNILALSEGDNITTMVRPMAFIRGQDSNDADHNGGTAINGPTGTYGLHKGEYIDEGGTLKYNNKTLNLITSDNSVKNSIQKNIINYAFSKFNDKLYKWQ